MDVLTIVQYIHKDTQNNVVLHSPYIVSMVPSVGRLQYQLGMDLQLQDKISGSHHRGHRLQVRVVIVVLVQLVERLGLRAGAAAVPRRRGQGHGRVFALLVCEDVLEGLGPLDTVVEALEFPELLEEVQEGAVRVGGVLGVHGTLVVDEGVGGDVWGDDERRDAIVCTVHQRAARPATR